MRQAAQRPRALAWRQDRLHPPFPQDIGAMRGLGKGAARRLGHITVDCRATCRAKHHCVFARQPGQPVLDGQSRASPASLKTSGRCAALAGSELLGGKPVGNNEMVL
jgi:hypothetical protein